MYSPKIDEDLTSVLYKMAKAEGRPMTRVLKEMIRKAVAKDTSPRSAVMDFLFKLCFVSAV